jgi:hypothetical protein
MEIPVSRKSNATHAFLAACALSPMSSASWGAVVTVHVPTPVVHINAPVIIVKPPVASAKLPVRPLIDLGRGSQRLVDRGAATGRKWRGRNSGGAETASSTGVTVTPGSNGKTTSLGNAVYTATATSTGENGAPNGIGRNWPIQFGVPNGWPTLARISHTTTFRTPHRRRWIV